MKRTSNSPTGLTPEEKRLASRGQDQQIPIGLIGGMEKMNEGQERGVDQQKFHDARSESGRSVTSSRRREMNKEFSYERPKDDGPWRNVVTVEILWINGEDYKGTVRPREAKVAVYETALGLDLNNLHGIDIEFRGHPVISYRLKTQINVDLKFGLTDRFCYNRTVGERTDKIEGKIRGVRLGIPNLSRKDSRRVKIKNCKWNFSEEQIMEWLGTYGNAVVPLVEETLDLSEGEDEEEEDEYGTGNYWLTMELEKAIPQFLPMFGRKIEIYYRGMEMTCMNCYRNGHRRANCKEEKREWMDYVSEFIEANTFSPEMYGKWEQISKTYMKKFRNESNTNPEESVEKVKKAAAEVPRELRVMSVMDSASVLKQSTSKTNGVDVQMEESRTGVRLEQEVNNQQQSSKNDSSREDEQLRQIEQDTSAVNDSEDWNLASYRKSQAYKRNTGKTYTDAVKGPRPKFTRDTPTPRPMRKSTTGEKVRNPQDV